MSTSDKPGGAWLAIVHKSGTVDFASAFVSTPMLEASVLNRPCVGVDAISAFFAATSRGLYDNLNFTHETVDGPKTYLEWEGKAFGNELSGTTILTRDEAGLIQSIRLYHLPLESVRLIAENLEKRLKG